MAQQPTNPKLWQMIISQARARFATYPSPAASHWVHDQYTKSGGKFFDPAEINRRKVAAEQYREAISKHYTEQKQDHDKRESSK